MKKISLLFVMIITTVSVFAQIFTEEFNYATGQLTATGTGANVSGGTWTSTGTPTNNIQVVPGSLSYPGYPGSGIGNMVNLLTGSSTNEKPTMPFSVGSLTGGKTIFYSALMNITDTVGLFNNGSAGTGDYIMGIGGATATQFYARLQVRKGASGNTVNFGLVRNSGITIVWSPVDYAVGTTHLIVVAYYIVSGSANDSAALWVNPSLSGGIPPSLVLSNASTSDMTACNTLLVRQNTNTPNCLIDGIRTDTTWTNMALPVTLTSFSAKYDRNNTVNLSWTTAQEINNNYFDIERTTDGIQYEVIGRVKGHGNHNSLLNYTFVDHTARKDQSVCYRLKQVDFDEAATHSAVVCLQPILNSAPQISTTPNPFSEQLTVRLEEQDKTTIIEISDMLGMIHISQSHTGGDVANLNTASLPSGIYFLKVLQDGQALFVQKVIKD